MTTQASTRRGIYTTLCSKFLFPLHELIKGHDSPARRRALDQSQWWSAAQIETHQVERLRAFLSKIGSTVPYYEKLFRRAAFDPAALTTLADLSGIPFLTKSIIRANTEELKARGATRLRRYNTGGSSGEPLVFFLDPARISHDVAARWRANRWWGVDIGDTEIVVWGSPAELGAQDWVRVLRDYVLRSSLLPAFEMSDANLDAFVKEIIRRRPTMLFGYPSVLAHIGRHAERHGLSLREAGVKVAFVTSERLYQDQRLQIARSFGCRVANSYGGRDSGLIASECPFGSMHLSAEDIIVEIIGEDGQCQPAGKGGEIVVTHMAGEGFPFVRYRTGDVGVLDDRRCGCGRGLPLIKEVLGRTTDFVVAKDGTLMHGLALIYVVRDLPGIEKFNITQETVDHTSVLLVPAADFDPQVIERIRTGMKARLGSSVDIEIQTVQDIPLERSGKFRYVTSKVVTR